MNKKGNESFGAAIKIALGIIILLLAFYFIWYLVTGQSILASIFKPYTEPQLSENAYFAAVGVNIANYGELGGKCHLVKGGEYSCAKDVQIEINVEIKNTGLLAIPVYARPRIGNTCNDKAECKGEAFLEGQRRCLIYDNKVQNCTINYKYDFNKGSTEYRIYPGAMMKKEDYLELTKEISATDKIIYNPNKWIIIKTR